MAVKRFIKCLSILGLMVTSFLVFLVVPTLGQENTLMNLSGVGLHYLAWKIDLTAGQRLKVDASCSDASGTGITGNIHEFHIDLWQRSFNYFSCFDVDTIFTVPYTGTYDIILHVHTDARLPDGEPDYSRFWFNYSVRLVDMDQSGPILPTPEVTSEPPTTPEVTAEPTATPEVTDEPPSTPEVTSEPTATPEVTAEPPSTPEATAEPSDEPEVTAEPTSTPISRPAAATPTPAPPRPAPPPDARLNWYYGDLTAVIYRGRDDFGSPSLVIYGVNEIGRGYLLCTVKKSDLGQYSETAPESNVFIKHCGRSVNIYVLTTGQIQVNIIEANKEFITMVESLAAREVRHYMIEA